jgi:hypothetical protein
MKRPPGYDEDGERFLTLCRQPEPELSTIRKMIDKRPDLLSYKGVLMDIPLCDAISVSRTNADADADLIVFLIEECYRLSLLGDVKHYGMIIQEYNISVLSLLVEKKKIQALERLIESEMPFFVPKDVKRFNLLPTCLRSNIEESDTTGIDVLKMLLKIDPSAVSTKCDFEGTLPIENVKHHCHPKLQLQIYRILIDEGLRQGIPRGGLLANAQNGNNPLQNLIQVADIDTLNYLVSTNPPLLQHDDLEVCDLLGNTWRSHNMVAFKYLLFFHPDYAALCLPKFLATIVDFFYTETVDESILKLLNSLIQMGFDLKVYSSYDLGGLLVSTSLERGTVLNTIVNACENPQKKLLLGRFDNKQEKKRRKRITVQIFLKSINQVLKRNNALCLHAIIQSDLCDKIHFFLPTFQWSIKLKDKDGRIPLQTALMRKEACSLSIICTLLDSQRSSISLKDPLTGLYPFGLAALTGDLEVCYYLLRQEPDLIYIPNS